MRFYCYRDIVALEKGTDAFELFKQKVAIVEHLLTPPASIPLIESNFQEYGLGKKAGREVITTTTSTLLIIILLAMLIFLLNGLIIVPKRYEPYRDILFMVPIIFYILWIGIRKEYWASAQPKLNNNEINIRKQAFLEEAKHKNDRKIEIELFFNYTFLSEKEKRKRSRAISICVKKEINWWTDIALLNVPFSLRNIWLWSFAIAVFTLFFNKDYHVQMFGTINNDMFSKFMADFFRALLIGVVSYIATNVISELLQLREQYVDGKRHMESLKRTIDKANSTMENTVHNVETIYSISGISENLKTLRESLSKSNPLTTVFDDFTKIVSNQLEIFNSKVSGDEIIDMWLFSTVNQYFVKTSEEFKYSTSLITKFEFFGEILRTIIDSVLSSQKFLERFKEEYEIYTVLVLPPKRFLNYDEDGKKRNAAWDAFINSCTKAKNSGLKMNRHFLSINFNNVMEKTVVQYFGSESKELEKHAFQKQLEQKYYYSNEQESNQDIILSTDDKASYMQVDDSSANIEGYMQKQLSEILKEIHYDNSCKVIELTIPNDLTETNGNEKLGKLDDKLWDKKTDKTLDYLAIRKKTGNKEWLFCFQTVLDESFDFAYVKIHHSKNKTEKWGEICEHLNKVFLTDKSEDTNGILRDEALGISIYPINNYK